MKPRPPIKNIKWQNLKAIPAYQGLALRALRIPLNKVGFVWIGDKQYYLCISRFRNGKVVSLWNDQVTKISCIYKRFFKTHPDES